MPPWRVLHQLYVSLVLLLLLLLSCSLSVWLEHHPFLQVWLIRRPSGKGPVVNRNCSNSWSITHTRISHVSLNSQPPPHYHTTRRWIRIWSIHETRIKLSMWLMRGLSLTSHRPLRLESCPWRLNLVPKYKCQSYGRIPSVCVIKNTGCIVQVTGQIQRRMYNSVPFHLPHKDHVIRLHGEVPCGIW